MVLVKNVLDLDPFSIGIVLKTKDDMFESEKIPAVKLI